METETAVNYRDGFITGLFLVLLFSFRFLVEFLKASQENFENSMALNMGQILSLPAMLTGLIILFVVRQKQTGFYHEILILRYGFQCLGKPSCRAYNPGPCV
jgi:prolipoprotein diacylglyceryltransferase